MKNISYHPESQSIPRFEAAPEVTQRMERILRTHGERVEAFLRRSCPAFVPGWTIGTTSFRSIEEQGRKLKPRSSNELVHVDAGAYGATNGARILRFFVNIHPTRDRVWGTKGSFYELVRRIPRYSPLRVRASPLRAWTKGPLDKLYSGLVSAASKLYPLLRVIDSSPYDRSMRRIHNYMKENPSFRDSRDGYREIHFPPLSAWMVVHGRHQPLRAHGSTRARNDRARAARELPHQGTLALRGTRPLGGVTERAVARLHFTQNLARHTHCPSADLAAATVAELLERYFTTWPAVRGYVLDDQGAVRHHVKILVDGRNIRDRQKLADELNNDSQVYVFQALSGG